MRAAILHDTNTRRRHVAALAIAIAFAAAGTAAQENALFQPVEPETEGRAAEEDGPTLATTARIPTRGGDTIRHRAMRVDFSRLAAVRASLESGRSAHLDLNLFDDVVFKAVDLRMAPTSSGGYSLSGHIEGVPLGTATLVVNGEIVIGSIRTPTGTYTIDANGSVCHIRRVDASSLPPRGEPLLPPASMLSPGRTSAGDAALPTSSAGADDEEGSIVDVLVVYTPAVREAVGGVLPAIALVDLFVAETNQAYTDSDVDLQVFLTRAVEVDYQEAQNGGLDLFQLQNPSDGHMDIVHELREKTGSDLVHLVADARGLCGIAYLLLAVRPEFETLGFGVTNYGCGGITFAHELGHNMGLRHDRFVDSTNTPFPYGHGYVNRVGLEVGSPETSRWRTLMSYPNECQDAGIVCEELLRFSNAEQEYEGDPMGIAEGDEAADARRGLNDSRRLVAGYRVAGPDLTATPLITDRSWDVGQSNIIVIGVVRNEGRIESTPTVAKFYRSPDPTITADDVELASYEVAPLGGKESYEPVLLETAPEAGAYYYGMCVDPVDGETDTENCSAGLYVTVGPTVSVADSETNEGETLSFAVSLSEARDTAVDVEWELTRDTAVTGVDFADVNGTVTIPANQTTASISVETIDDDVPEADDTFTVALTKTTPAPPAGVVLSFDGAEATGTILNDDGDPQFADSTLRAAVLLALNKPSDGEITVEDLASLQVLDAPGTADEKIDDLTGLEAATGLEALQLPNNEVADLTPLGHLSRLTELDLDYNGLTDLAALASIGGLTTLSLTGNPVLDIAPLADLTTLQVLTLRCADRADFPGRAQCEEESLTDISALAELTDLHTLDLNFNNVVDIRPLAKLTRLNYLDLWGNEIHDLSPLEDLVNLFWMDLDDNEITDVGPLANLSILQALHLNGNAVGDISPLAGLDNLDTLGLNGNGISDIGALRNLERLRLLWLGENSISDLSPLAKLDQLELLDVGNNDVADISVLAGFSLLEEVHLQNNRVRDVSPLASLRRLGYLDLSNNDIRDIEPLVSNSRLGNGDNVHIQGNPLTDTSLSVHVPALLERGVELTYIGVSVAAGSALEGSEMEFVVRVSPAAAEDVAVNWAVAGLSASAGDDFPMSQSDRVDIAAGDTQGTFTVATTEDAERERHELIEVHLTEGVAFPDGVGLAGEVEEDGDDLRATALGLIVDPEGTTEDVPLFAAASDQTRQGFVRVINHGERNVVHIVAADDTGNRHTTTLAMEAGETVHFNSNDLEGGNIGKGLSRGVEAGAGDWRLALSGNDVDVLTYMRTNDGFLTSLHDVVPAGSGGHSVPIFNPGKNTDQESLLRLINDGETDATVTITGIDDAGASSGEATVVLAAGEARTLSAADLEKGTGLDGMLGTGTGKWRLSVQSDQPVLVSSLMQTPTGHLTNLSTVADNQVAAGDETTHHVYLFPSAADPDARQGFVRVINRGEAGSVSIKAYDGTDTDRQPVTLTLDANETVHFNSRDLEAGAEGKGLPLGVGAGEGDWRLELTSALDLDVLAYIRRTEDGFLTSMHDIVPAVDGVHRVPIFNPGSNRNQVSKLLLVNAGETAAEVTIAGVDDRGRPSAGSVGLSVPAGGVRAVSAQALEAGADDLRGALGDGAGKWSLDVNADRPIRVINLLESPTGHLTNLSTMP